MKPALRIAILAAVVLAVVAIVVLKQRESIRPASPVPPTTTKGSVLLFANLAEAGEGEDGCAVIIRTVRAARQHGVRVTEFNSGSSPEVRKQHRVVVDPTVIVLDPTGHEIARHEGEDAATVAAIRADIEGVSRGPA